MAGQVTPSRNCSTICVARFSLHPISEATLDESTLQECDLEPDAVGTERAARRSATHHDRSYLALKNVGDPQRRGGRGRLHDRTSRCRTTAPCADLLASSRPGRTRRSRRPGLGPHPRWRRTGNRCVHLEPPGRPRSGCCSTGGEAKSLESPGWREREFVWTHGTVRAVTTSSGPPTESTAATANFPTTRRSDHLLWRHWTRWRGKRHTVSPWTARAAQPNT